MKTGQPIKHFGESLRCVIANATLCRIHAAVWILQGIGNWAGRFRFAETLGIAVVVDLKRHARRRFVIERPAKNDEAERVTVPHDAV